jgi:GDP-4-dehydro-6-deoxy-D-mannose reductase
VAAEFLGVQAHLAHGLEVIRVRPFNHVGPGQSTHFAVPALASRIVAAIGDGESWIPVGNLAAKRDLTDVRDVVRAYRLLVLGGVPGSVYNVCSGRAVAIEDVTRRLLELSGADLELRTDPSLVRPIDVPVLEGDPGRLEKRTGWRPEIELDRTLTDVLVDVGLEGRHI